MLLTLSLTTFILGSAVTQNRPVDPFHQLSLSGSVKAKVVKGDKPALTLQGESDALEKVEAFVKDGELVIRPKTKTGWFTKTGQITAEITVPSLDAIDLSGGSSATGMGVTGTACTLDLSGGTKVDLEGLQCEKLAVDASGGAVVTLKGNARTLALDVSGGVVLQTQGLAVKDANIDASGGVTGVVAVADQLNADLSGGVSLTVKGQPKVRNLDTSGGARATFEN
jgi:hypothetical protein